MSSNKKIRVAVIGVGDFGRNHARVYRSLENCELIGVVDRNAERAAKVAEEFGTKPISDWRELAGRVDAVSVAVPTVEHASIGCSLMEQGVDVLVEKPMAVTLAEADALIAAAQKHSRILQIGHLERFNPAVVAVQPVIARPLFFEVHRLGIFTPRSLDIDVVFDVMIHDLDILLALVNAPVVDLKAVGIPVITEKVDIAHARVEFATGAVANVTASRVSTERVRKMRFFQEHEYVSLDYIRQDALRIRVAGGGPQPQFGFEKLATVPVEPLLAELRSFVDCLQTRATPVVDGLAGRRALELAGRVMSGIQEHAGRVQIGTLVPES